MTAHIQAVTDSHLFDILHIQMSMNIGMTINVVDVVNNRVHESTREKKKFHHLTCLLTRDHTDAIDDHEWKICATLQIKAYDYPQTKSPIAPTFPRITNTSYNRNRGRPISLPAIGKHLNKRAYIANNHPYPAPIYH
jgi:hypothetical protein